ncbi:MAG: hypothetical protein ACM3JB_16590, partial [Acidobacteriaceae bacterium]
MPGTFRILRQVHRPRTPHIHFSPGIAGVAPLEGGNGCFLLRRLQWLSEIFPIGAFPVEHFFFNAFAQNVEMRTTKTSISWLASFCFFLELFVIWIPIAFHAL